MTNHPKVKHIPEWFPGAGFKRFAKEGRRLSELTVDGPLEYVKEGLKVGSLRTRKLASIPGLTVMMSLTETTFPLLHHASIVLALSRIKDSTKAIFEGWLEQHTSVRRHVLVGMKRNPS